MAEKATKRTVVHEIQPMRTMIYLSTSSDRLPICVPFRGGPLSHPPSLKKKMIHSFDLFKRFFKNIKWFFSSFKNSYYYTKVILDVWAQNGTVLCFAIWRFVQVT